MVTFVEINPELSLLGDSRLAEAFGRSNVYFFNFNHPGKEVPWPCHLSQLTIKQKGELVSWYLAWLSNFSVCSV